MCVLSECYLEEKEYHRSSLKQRTLMCFVLFLYLGVELFVVFKKHYILIVETEQFECEQLEDPNPLRISLSKSSFFKCFIYGPVHSGTKI